MALEYARKEYTASVLVKATGREYRRLVIQLSKRRENFRLIFRLLSDRPGHSCGGMMTNLREAE
jgi:hypothetical protein